MGTRFLLLEEEGLNPREMAARFGVTCLDGAEGVGNGDEGFSECRRRPCFDSFRLLGLRRRDSLVNWVGSLFAFCECEALLLKEWHDVLPGFSRKAR